jgi:hypothetical protein
MEPTTEEIINKLPQVEFANKPESALYDASKLNFKDVNELKTVINKLAKAFGNEMRRKDATIAALTERVEQNEKEIGRGLVAAGFVQPDYLQP